MASSATVHGVARRTLRPQASGDKKRAMKNDYCWRIDLDADGDMHELTFGRAGARISEQSENAAAVVVYL